MATVYQYNADGFYLGATDDFGGPLPHNCTNVKPKKEDGFIAQWNGGKWQQVEDHRGSEGWLDGKPYTITQPGPQPDGFSTEPPQPTLEEKQAAIVAAIQNHLDAFARTRNYDNIFTAATYAVSHNPQFALEGQYAVQARDLTWAKCYEVLNEVMAGQRPEPSLDEIMAELPALAWPEV